ncbi:helix-turn-helix transcriptional regulator [Enterocloster citroniae]|uniref:helix-turn-helix transcriptional regulator n=1 Tax=Enterocloster citroniae TaxID=358743 RepID=UPI0008E7093A|nr:helix-turn-helix transcriptional regulator [Enterocloster citroniae]SFS14690.1 DNA-binding transcriptional regulator, XRE-family HTH domain [Enterocloster citroniae]
MSFSENMQYLRKKENLTQEQLAACLDVSRQAVSKWESGVSIVKDMKPQLTLTLPIANFFAIFLLRIDIVITKQYNKY